MLEKYVITNHDFIVYDIEEKDDGIINYFFVCQNHGHEKTISNKTVLDIFKDCFLNTLNDELMKDNNLRMSLSELNDFTWESTCEILNVNLSFKNVFASEVFSLSRDLSTIDENDILSLNLNITGSAYDTVGQNFKDNVCFLVYRNTNDFLDVIEKDVFLSLTYKKSTSLKQSYEAHNIERKMVEINKESLKFVCLDNNIKYIQNNIIEENCNHEYVFSKRYDSNDLELGDDIISYSFRCKHCDDIKHIVNYDIVSQIHKSSIEHIKNQLSLCANKRSFNFIIFDLVLSEIFKKENIHHSFKEILLKDYPLPKLSKELILVKEDSLDKEELTFTTSICESTGIFSKRILNNLTFKVIKSNLNNDITLRKVG